MEETKEDDTKEVKKAKQPKVKQSTMLKASEWAHQDGDKPDPHLFLWWDSKGVIGQSEYEEIKNQVFRKK